MITALAIAATLVIVAAFIALTRRRPAAIGLMVLWPVFATAILLGLKATGQSMAYSDIVAAKVGFAWSCVVCHCMAIAFALAGERGQP